MFKRLKMTEYIHYNYLQNQIIFNMIIYKD